MTQKSAGNVEESSTCIHSYIAVPVGMLLFLYSLLGVLSQTLQDALEHILLGVKCSANAVSLVQFDLQMPMQQHHLSGTILLDPG